MTDAAGSTPALVVAGLSKSFGRLAVLDGVDLVVPTGSVTAVLGPSGGGKTTLLRIIAGFEDPDSGTVTIAGAPVASATASVPPERRRVGVVPQEGALFPHLDVAGNVGFGLPRGAASVERVREVLDLVGLPGVERKRPHELSGGQQHRVALARALAPRPSLVVLDEPFSSLDAGLRVQVRDEVLLALERAKTTAVVVTHDQQEALSIADQVAVLLDGRVAQTADPATLYEQPASLAVATFVGEAIVLRGIADGAHAMCALGSVPLRSGSPRSGPVFVVVRPEQVDLLPVVPYAAPPDGVTGNVVSRSFFGHDGVVRVALDDATVVSVRVHAARLPRRGATVALHVDAPVSAFATDDTVDSAATGTSGLAAELPSMRRVRARP
ncbi:MAG: ABC transporter ATP-binding protein [Acidimicrobiia bacterium]